MRPILFHLGEFPVPSFWVAAFTGFFMAFLVVRSEVVRRGWDVDVAYDLILYTYVGGWIGARLFLIPTGWSYFTEDPIGFLLSGSGWVWYGGVIGGAVAAWLLSWRRGLPLLECADIAGPALAIGLAIGRIGCQLAGDGDYGVPTDLPWGMSYPDGVVPTTERVHPAPVYEMVASFAIFAYLWRRRREPAGAGQLFGRYLILAAIARFAIEFVRRNPAWLLGLTTAQWLSVALVVVGAALLRRGVAAADPTPSPGVPVPSASVARHDEPA